MNTKNQRRLTKKQVGEYLAREFLGDDVWIRWKQDLDSLLQYRNSIKGRPSPEEMVILEINKPWIQHYNGLLYSNMT